MGNLIFWTFMYVHCTMNIFVQNTYEDMYRVSKKKVYRKSVWEIPQYFYGDFLFIFTSSQEIRPF